MNRLKVPVVLSIIFTFFLCNNSIAGNETSQKSDSKTKRYTIKKACIEYTVSGDMNSGTEILYFDDFGMREAKYTTQQIKMGDMVMQETEQAAYTEGSTIYTVDLKTRTGTKASVASVTKPFEGQDLDKTGEKWMKQMGGEKIGTEEFLGKTCDVWLMKSMGTKTWIWQGKGVMLKTETNLGMKMTVTATKISESFDPKKLQRPTDIEYKEMGDVMDMLKKMKQGYKP